MNKRDYILITSFIVLGIITRIPLIETFQSHWDGPQYSIAIFRYSLEQQTPATPGYPLYIFMGWVVNLFLQNPHMSLLVLSVAFNVAGAFVIYFLCKEIFNRKVGLIAAILYFTSPSLYFFGLTAYAYGITVVFVIILALIVFKIYYEKKISGVLLGLVSSILIGVRPQELLLVWPLMLLGFVSLKREKYLFLFSFIFTTLIWFIPFFLIVGKEDFTNYIFPGGGGNMPPISFSSILSAKEALIKGLYLTVGVAAVSLIYYSYVFIKKPGKIDRRLVLFFAIWIVPPLLFNLFVRSDHAGYQLTYLSGVIVLVSFAICRFFNFSKPLLILLVLFLSFSNMYTFFRDRDPSMQKPYVPTSFHYFEIRKNDLRMGEKIEFIKKNFNPNETVVVIGDYNLFRPVMYHLPEYNVIQVSALIEDDKRFRYYIREGKSYNMKEFKSTDQTIVISQAIKKVVIFDDESSTWRISDSKSLKLPHNSYMTIVENYRRSIFKYGYAFFEKK